MAITETGRDGMRRLRLSLAGLKTPGGLGRRAFAAGGWLMAQSVVRLGMRLVSNLILTRLLLPDAFALMAMVSTLLAALELLTDVAVPRSIVREPDGDTPDFLRTAWTVKILRSLGVGAVVVAAAALLWQLAPGLASAGTVYADPRLPGLIAASALAPVFRGFLSSNVPLARRQLNLRLIAIHQILAQVASLVCMVALAMVWASPWALLFGMLSSGLVALILSFVMFPGPSMRLQWTPEIAQRLWTFGRWLIASSALTFVANYADKLILAGLLGSGDFGLYSIAMIWIGAGVTLLRQITDQVGYPVLSQINRDRPDEMQRLFRRLLRMVDLACLAAMAAGIFLGPHLIRLLYHGEYEITATYLPFLSLMFLSVRFDVFGMLILATGKSRSLFRISGSRAVALCLSLPLGWRFGGLEGVLIAVALSSMAGAIYSIRIAETVIGTGKRYQDIAWACLPFLLAVGIHFLYAGQLP